MSAFVSKQLPLHVWLSRLVRAVARDVARMRLLANEVAMCSPHKDGWTVFVCFIEVSSYFRLPCEEEEKKAVASETEETKAKEYADIIQSKKVVAPQKAVQQKQAS